MIYIRFILLTCFFSCVTALHDYDVGGHFNKLPNYEELNKELVTNSPIFDEHESEPIQFRSDRENEDRLRHLLGI